MGKSYNFFVLFLTAVVLVFALAKKCLICHPDNNDKIALKPNQRYSSAVRKMLKEVQVFCVSVFFSNIK